MRGCLPRTLGTSVQALQPLQPLHRGGRLPLRLPEEAHPNHDVAPDLFPDRDGHHDACEATEHDTMQVRHGGDPPPRRGRGQPPAGAGRGPGHPPGSAWRHEVITEALAIVLAALRRRGTKPILLAAAGLWSIPLLGRVLTWEGHIRFTVTTRGPHKRCRTPKPHWPRAGPSCFTRKAGSRTARAPAKRRRGPSIRASSTSRTRPAPRSCPSARPDRHPPCRRSRCTTVMCPPGVRGLGSAPRAARPAWRRAAATAPRKASTRASPAWAAREAVPAWPSVTDAHL